MESWIEAYRSNQYAQIYIDDPRDGLFQSWRLTCDGSEEYLIERRYFGANVSVENCGYPQIITRGAIYYTFGEDLTEIDWLPLTIHKGLSHQTEISEDDLWVQQATISEEQAIALAAEAFEYYKDCNGTYQFVDRFVDLGQCYYSLKVLIGEDRHHGGNVAVSADGSVFWDTTHSWNLVKDISAVKVLTDASDHMREPDFPSQREFYNWLKDSAQTEHSVSLGNLYVDSDTVPAGYISYMAPEDCVTCGGGVLCWNKDNMLEHTDYGFKFGEFQVFGEMENWELRDSNGEINQMSSSVIEKYYPMDDPESELIISNHNIPGALKETEKYHRIVERWAYHINYLVDLGNGYGATVYFYVSPDFTKEEFEVYDRIVESMTLVLE